MKILVLGDVHGNEKFFARACRVAAREGCDHILQVGDFGYWEHYSHGARFLAVAEFELQDKGLTCYWIDGNHENHPLLWEKYGPTPSAAMDEDDSILYGTSQGEPVEVRPHLFYLPRGFRWSWAGTSFLACGGAHSIDRDSRTPGATWWGTETITPEQVEACGTDKVDVLVSHDVVNGFDLPALAFKYILPEVERNRDNLSRIAENVQPNLILHGHYHHRFGDWHTLRSGKKVRIEGLGADLDGDERSWLILDLQDLSVGSAASDETADPLAERWSDFGYQAEGQSLTI